LEGGRLSHFCPKNISKAPEKQLDYMLTCKIALPDSPHPISIKIPDFGHFILLDGMNAVFSFNKYKKYIFFHFWLLALLPEKFSFCPKNNGFARLRGAAIPPIPWLVRLWSAMLLVADDRLLKHNTCTFDLLAIM